MLKTWKQRVIGEKWNSLSVVVGVMVLVVMIVTVVALVAVVVTALTWP